MKLIKITDEKLLFDDGTVVSYEHEQKCCENVYADFEQLEDGLLNKEIDSIVIQGVNGAGVRINGYFIPCYNEQNGYYTSDLELVIKKNDSIVIVDISDFVKDEIDP